MSKLPVEVAKAWEDRNGPVVLATVDADGTPNIIYASCVGKFDEETLVVADNYFDKTKTNITRGSRGSLLFITKDDSAFQVKGQIEYHKSGPVYDDMKKWNPEKLPGHAAAALKVEEVFQGAKKIV